MPNTFSASPAQPADTAAFFATLLACQTDVSDVHQNLEAGTPGFVLADCRSEPAWRQGHLPGAIHLPTVQIAARARAMVAAGTVVVTYCWGPGCNGATRGALEFARLGYQVKEMIGGYEYWVREGYPVLTSDGPARRMPDDLTALRSGAAACGC